MPLAVSAVSRVDGHAGTVLRDIVAVSDVVIKRRLGQGLIVFGSAFQKSCVERESKDPKQKERTEERRSNAYQVAWQ